MYPHLFTNLSAVVCVHSRRSAFAVRLFPSLSLCNHLLLLPFEDKILSIYMLGSRRKTQKEASCLGRSIGRIFIGSDLIRGADEAKASKSALKSEKEGDTL